MQDNGIVPAVPPTCHTPSIRRRTLLAAGAGLGLVGAASLTPAPAHAVTVRASDYGFDPVDGTTAIQAALDSTADTVVIDNVGADWVTRPLFLRRSNVTVLFEPGVVVRAKVGGFPGLNDSLLTVDDQEYVTILGYGAQVIMNFSEYTTGEWRMCLSLRGVRHTTVEGLTLKDSGGDGVYLGVSATNPSAPRYSQDVTLRNLVCDRHRRNSLSVISVDGLLVEGCAFTRAIGTAPRSGIDFEPNNANERLANIVVRDCVLTGNVTTQMVFAVMKLTSTSTPISILVERVVMDEQTGGSPILMYNGSGASDPGGTIEIRDSVIRNDHGTGNLGFWRHSASGAHITVRRCVIWNWGLGAGTYRPITFNSGDATSYGGVTFDDTVLATDQASPMINVIEAAGTHLENVHGRLTVIGPASVTTNYGAAPVAVDPTVTAVAATANSGALGSTIAVSPASRTITPGSPATFTFTRTGGLTTRPMAVRYSLGGTARHRTDYAGVSGIVVLPAGATSATVTIATRSDAIAGSTIVPAITAMPFYN